MPLPGQVFQIHPMMSVGPWMHPGQQHRALVISNHTYHPDGSIVVVPMTGSKPSPWLASHVEMKANVGGLTAPMWILCEYVIAVHRDTFKGLSAIASFAGNSAEMGEVRRCLAQMFRII